MDFGRDVPWNVCTRILVFRDIIKSGMPRRGISFVADSRGYAQRHPRPYARERAAGVFGTNSRPQEAVLPQAKGRSGDGRSRHRDIIMQKRIEKKTGMGVKSAN